MDDCRNTLAKTSERLAEYGWKPHRGFVGSKRPITSLILRVYARNTEGYGFTKLEISSRTISAVFRQPLNQVSTDYGESVDALERAIQATSAPTKCAHNVRHLLGWSRLGRLK